MTNITTQVKQKFYSLNKSEKILTVLVFSIIIGGFLFSSGVQIGSALYKIAH